jgi:PIN domain nuclease of toxin-antitoxin system
VGNANQAPAWQIESAAPLVDIVTHQQATNGVVILPVLPMHVFALDGLPTPHRDPFDRLLVAQANSEGATLVSADAIFRSYPVCIAW